jgi:hypothetical protein
LLEYNGLDRADGTFPNSPDKARTLTCADQFNANKTTNANGGLKWIEMGGGYYSECVSRLKG